MKFRTRDKVLVGLAVVVAIGSGLTAAGTWDATGNTRDQAAGDSASQVSEQSDKLTRQQAPLRARASWEMLFLTAR